MNLESHARRVSGEYEYHAARSLHAQAPIGTVYRLLTAAGDDSRQASQLELRVIAKDLDLAEELLGQQADRLMTLIDHVRDFAEAVNDALADAEAEHVAPEWSVHVNGLDEDAIDRIARFYTDRGHEIR